MPGQNGELYIVELGAHEERLMLNEYKGKISLIVCKEGTDNKNYFRMVYPKGKGGIAAETAIPQGVRLGDRKQAAAILKQFIHVLEKTNG